MVFPRARYLVLYCILSTLCAITEVLRSAQLYVDNAQVYISTEKSKIHNAFQILSKQLAAEHSLYLRKVLHHGFGIGKNETSIISKIKV